MEKFKIKEEYLCNVTVKYCYTSNDKQFETISTVDHPSFDALRKHLEQRDFIKTTEWWNGDSVLKEFELNGKVFSIGDKFPCACAMIGCLRYK